MSLEVCDTPFGKFQIDPLDLIGMTTKAGTLWDGPGFLQVIAWEHGRLGEAGATILDVGANIGTFSCWLAMLGAWRVISVEAHPTTMRQLKANLDLNKGVTASRVIPLEIAAYDKHQSLGLRIFDEHNSGASAFAPEGAAPLWVEAAPLDDYRWLFGKRVSLIKLDIQGCELRALHGLRYTIQQHWPVIVFEWEPEHAILHGDLMEAVERFFAALGYVIHPWPSQPSNFLALPV